MTEPTKTVLNETAMVNLDNFARGLASQLRNAEADDPAIAAARVLRALIEAMESGDAQALNEMSGYSRGYLAKLRRRHKNKPNAWRYLDPWTERHGDAEALRVAMHEARARLARMRIDEARKDGSRQLASTFVWEIYSGHGILRTQLRKLKPDVVTDGTMYDSKRAEELIKPVAEAFYALRGRQADNEAYVRAGLIALGYPKSNAEDFFKYARQRKLRKRR